MQPGGSPPFEAHTSLLLLNDSTSLSRLVVASSLSLKRRRRIGYRKDEAALVLHIFKIARRWWLGGLGLGGGFDQGFAVGIRSHPDFYIRRQIVGELDLDRILFDSVELAGE